MKPFLMPVCFLICACVLLMGCSDNGYNLSKQDLAAFQNAAPAIKQAWEQGLKADQANDYLTASTNYRAVLSQQINAEQLIAVQTALGGMNYRMNEAAAKGDAAAQKAIATLKEGEARR